MRDLKRVPFVLHPCLLPGLEYHCLLSHFVFGELYSILILSLNHSSLPLLLVYPLLVFLIGNFLYEGSLPQRSFDPLLDLLLVPGQLGDSRLDGVLLVLLDLELDLCLQAIGDGLVDIILGGRAAFPQGSVGGWVLLLWRNCFLRYSEFVMGLYLDTACLLFLDEEVEGVLFWLLSLAELEERERLGLAKEV